jgi:SAM-dependent methyltransferase
LQWLDPQPGDRILDLGCGDGSLTRQIATAVASKPGEVLGLDSSPAFISSANESISTSGIHNVKFVVEDCAASAEDSQNGTWTKVFSNAAMHWIMRAPQTRTNILKRAYSALKPGGTFVFEMGGAGNVSEVVTGLISALVHFGLTFDEARDKIPWFFPDDEWMTAELVKVGFKVEQIELQYRPTKLTPKDDSGGGGLEGWISLFAGGILDSIENKTEFVKYVYDALETAVTREDGSQYLGYVRLRAIARRPT